MADIKPEATDIVEMPDIPMPSTDAVKTEIDDTFPAAFKFAIIGAGQGGSRIAEQFWNIGYRRICVINTALQDLGMINIPEDRKLAIDTSGAGKNPERAAAVIREKSSDVYDLMRRCFGTGFDWILICAGAGGGTGGGTTEELVTLAHELATTLKAEKGKECRVGVLVALPKNAEGPKPNANALHLMKKLSKLADAKKISPLIIIDNERITSLYPTISVSSHWNVANQSICTLFHLFNTISVRDSRYTSFDKADYQTILASGIMTFGATPVKKWDGLTDIAFALRDNLARNILAVGATGGSVAGAITIGSEAILSVIPATHLEHGFEQMTRMMKSASTLHRGIYVGNKETLVVYTAIGGLEVPKERMEALAAVAHIKDWDDV